MAQCVTCQWAIVREAPKGKCRCWKEREVLGEIRGLLDNHQCKTHQLAPMIQVRARVPGRLVFRHGYAEMVRS